VISAGISQVDAGGRKIEAGDAAKPAGPVFQLSAPS
jgi:hypothetical protein